jgi:hypothetical protein
VQSSTTRDLRSRVPTVGKWLKEPLEDLGDNIFANNPFLDGLDWIDMGDVPEHYSTRRA